MKKIKQITAAALAAVLMLAIPATGEEGTWICAECGNENTKNFCGKDGTARPEEGWVCEACGESNTRADAKFCVYCAAPRTIEPTEWTCASSGTVNEATAKYCAICAAAKPSDNAEEEKQINSTLPESLNVGDTVTFGSYEQDGDESNGAEPIEWRVLETREDGTYLLLSEYVLEAKAYNDGREDVTWETCTLRSWLNGEFYETAFTEEERGKIQLTQVTNADNPTYGTEGGGDTEDYVYLLSQEEVQKYFKLEDDEEDWVLGKSRDLICMPTEHAVDSGAHTLPSEYVKDFQSEYSYELREGACWWWLRSPGSNSYYAARVLLDGYVDTDRDYVYLTDGCVRPVVVVRLS